MVVGQMTRLSGEWGIQAETNDVEKERVGWRFTTPFVNSTQGISFRAARRRRGDVSMRKRKRMRQSKLIK